MLDRPFTPSLALPRAFCLSPPLVCSMRAGFAGLPAEAVRHVAAKLTNMRDMCALGATCRGLHSLTQDTVPGVLLDLYPHQVPAPPSPPPRSAPPI